MRASGASVLLCLYMKGRKEGKEERGRIRGVGCGGVKFQIST